MEYHQPVLLEESIEGLKIKPDGVYVDATFGGGGHSRKILELLKTGKLIAFDQDDAAAANIPTDKRFIFVNHNFRFLKNFLKFHGFKSMDGLIADLGISSHHIDTPQRGFSFRFDAKLDMRMNTKTVLSAEIVVNTYSIDELTEIFRKYGEIDNAKQVARKIGEKRKVVPIERVNELVDAIRDCIPKETKINTWQRFFRH